MLLGAQQQHTAGWAWPGACALPVLFPLPPPTPPWPPCITWNMAWLRGWMVQLAAMAAAVWDLEDWEAGGWGGGGGEGSSMALKGGREAV